MIRPLLLTLGMAIVASSLSASAQSTPPLTYTPLATPCRAVDTRTTLSPIQGGTTRNFSPSSGGCNIPIPADGVIVYAANVTVVPHEGLGYLTVWPAGEAQPVVSLLNSYDARTKANAAFLTAGTSGDVSVFASNTTDFILDISGYFTTSTTGMVYVPVAPCRLIDTRNGTGGDGTTALQGPPQAGPLVPNLARTWEIAYPVTVDSPVPGANNCNLPYDVGSAYAVNVTVVPKGSPVWATSVWGSTTPTLQPGATPAFSNVNAYTATDTANAAIINGPQDLTAFVDVETDLVVDVMGWFAPANLAPEGLSLYVLPPCRALDTRQTETDGLPMAGLTVALSGQNGLPCPIPAGIPTPSAFVLNATIVPTSAVGYLTLWPYGQSEPVVSTLNANDGYVTSNMAIVGTAALNQSAQAIQAQASTMTKADLVLDESGVFAHNPTTRLPTVVFIGDETTANWPMADHPNWINKGIPGNTTDQMLARFQTDVINLHPDVVHIMGGSEDAIQQNWPGTSECGINTCENISEMAQMAYDAGIRVVIGTPLEEGDIDQEIEISLLDRQLRLNQGYGTIPYLLDYVRAGSAYSTMSQMAAAEIGLAYGYSLVEAHAIHEIQQAR